MAIVSDGSEPQRDTSERMANDRQPWFKWYPESWRGDDNVKGCSLAARGLWRECLDIMHNAPERGYLVGPNGPLTLTDLALFVGRPVKEVKAALAEIEQHKVSSRTDDGILFSRRMVRDTARAAKASVDGARGGNPTLKGEVKAVVKGEVKAALNPARAQTRGLVSKDLDLQPKEETPEPVQYTPGQLKGATVVALVAAWNNIAAAKPPLQPVDSDKVGPTASRALARQPNIAWWADVFKACAESDYLTGRDGKHAPITIWFALDKAEEIAGGKYTNRAEPKIARKAKSDEWLGPVIPKFDEVMRKQREHADRINAMFASGELK